MFLGKGSQEKEDDIGQLKTHRLWDSCAQSRRPRRSRDLRNRRCTQCRNMGESREAQLMIVKSENPADSKSGSSTCFLWNLAVMMGTMALMGSPAASAACGISDCWSLQQLLISQNL